MKYRVGACALMFVLAGCSGEGPDSSLASMRGSAATGTDAKLAVSLPASRASGKSIASAPDRGALVSYANKGAAAKREGAYTYFPVAISEEHAIKAILTGEMTVPSPDGSQVKLRYERHKEEVDGNWTWVGRVVNGDKMQEAIITFGEKAVYGSIPQANGKPPLSLQTRQGALWAVEVDPSKAASGNTGHTDMMVRPAAALRTSLGAATTQSATAVTQSATAVAQAAPPTAANTIDVAIGYTPEFAAANGGTSAATTRLVYLIQIGNQAFSNSQINGYLRLVHAVQVSYTNTNTNQTALTELTGSNGSSPVTVPASLAPLRTARDQYGADIAVLVRKFNSPENEGCGIAWLNGAGQTAITSADAAFGYAVVSDGTDQGTDGKTYYCAEETLVHESAHIMGSAHDRDNSKTSTGALQYGRYAYSFGYKPAAGNFYTVMAYGDTGQIAHRIFSTPLKNTCGAGANLACGVANSEDNARSLNQTIPVVAGFRATVVPFQSALPDDVTGDAKADLMWYFPPTREFYYWGMDGRTISQARGGFYIAQGYLAKEIADFNGDGLADILWSDGSFIRMFTANSSGGFSDALLARYPTGLELVGSGDVSGDGRADLFWFNPTTREFSYWLLNGATVASSQGGFIMASGYTARTVGDFNGDGLADIIWSNGTHVRIFSPISGGGWVDRFVYAYPAGWNLIGAGDIDGDGKDDVMWHHGTTREFYYWLLDGSTIKDARGGFIIAPGYTARKVSDFNGDGLADIVWSDGVRLRMFLNSGNGGFTDGLVNQGYPAGWTLVGR